MLMNFVSIKTKDKSVARTTGSSAPSAAPGGPSNLIENQVAISNRSTNDRNVAEGGEEV